MRERTLGAALSALLWFGLVACGGDEDPGGTGAGIPAHGGSGGSGGIAGAAGQPAGGHGGAAGGAGGGPVGGSSAVPLDGFGTIAGDCGVIDPTHLQSPSPYDFQNHLDFATLDFDYDALSSGGQEIYDDGNLGGSSIYSEIFSYEVLYRCELAALLKTEGEIIYTDPAGKKTDLLVSVDGLDVGVSVTRAFKFPPTEPYTPADALALLQDKLSDVLESSANVDPVDGWTKQILHVMAYADEHAASLAQAYEQLDDATKADTILIVTVTDGNDDFLY